MEKINGLDSLTALFNGNESKDRALIEYIVQSSYFMPIEVVKEQSQAMLKAIKNKEPLSVRLKSVKTAFYKQNEKKRTHFSSEQQAKQYAASNVFYHEETDLPVKFDSTGNTAVSDEITRYTKHLVGSTDKCTILNYEMTHIWDYTEHPLYFSSLWNIVLVPFVFARLTDKTSSKVFLDLSNLLKAVSITLYEPEKLLGKEYELINFEFFPNHQYFSWAQELINEEKIQYLPIIK